MFTNWGKSNNCGTQLKFGLNRSSTSNGWPEYGRVEQVAFDGVDNEVTTMMMTMMMRQWWGGGGGGGSDDENTFFKINLGRGRFRHSS